MSVCTLSESSNVNLCTFATAYGVSMGVWYGIGSVSYPGNSDIALTFGLVGATWTTLAFRSFQYLHTKTPSASVINKIAVSILAAPFVSCYYTFYNCDEYGSFMDGNYSRVP